MQTEREAVGKTGDKFAAFVSRYHDVALVEIFPRSGRYSIDFQSPVAAYETLSSGAHESARREVRRLEQVPA